MYVGGHGREAKLGSYDTDFFSSIPFLCCSYTRFLFHLRIRSNDFPSDISLDFKYYLISNNFAKHYM